MLTNRVKGVKKQELILFQYTLCLSLTIFELSIPEESGCLVSLFFNKHPTIVSAPFESTKSILMFIRGREGGREEGK